MVAHCDGAVDALEMYQADADRGALDTKMLSGFLQGLFAAGVVTEADLASLDIRRIH
ncbi:MAG: hypothetical protein KJ755_21085 [Alphaproteobacteria bacterium]|nr:hypothetical protein [Gammaproteobacteria bacterium]MBU0852238.1 hypothetical protein [Gammaproteobacteria bacterium]MBU1461722.1 hypothetical protein [Gammaproteobacteria bacterium]MBU1772769.1 hypothetical protein [Gammaproteobacteria bacterium]MBU2329820.1 hypothetical protein [Alphaproteobacteria bacterium]